jgi:hypothetical protein
VRIKVKIETKSPDGHHQSKTTTKSWQLAPPLSHTPQIQVQAITAAATTSSSSTTGTQTTSRTIATAIEYG